MTVAEPSTVRSTHKVEVVRVKPEPHPDADRLLVVPVFGYTCCIGIADWAEVERDPEGYILAAYVPPDSVVDTRRPEFEFLRYKPRFDKDGKLVGRMLDESITEVRTKAKRLRGVISFGFLVPAPPGTQEGDDLAERLGVRHFEPAPEEEKAAKRYSMTGGEASSPPAVAAPYYDVDAHRRWPDVFRQGEPVVLTEKLDGSSAKYVFVDGKMYCGSRDEWKREFPSFEHVTLEALLARGVPEKKAADIVDRTKNRPPKKNLWWYALERTPSLRAFCEANPGVVVYGEVFGRQGRLKYTDQPDEVFFAAFDVLKDGRWLDAEEGRHMLQFAGVPVVPILAGESPLEIFPAKLCGTPYDFNTVCKLAEGPSLWPGSRCIREGVVVKPLRERFDRKVGRVQLKEVSPTYLEKFRKER